MSVQAHPPILLTMPEYCGTLAAARSCGAMGLEVMTAGADPLAPAGFSKHVRRRLSCPSLSEPDALLEWLSGYGRRNPGTVLYPTADDVAWLQVVHAKELPRDFRLYAPGPQALETPLDKRQV